MQAPLSAAADDRFDHPDVAELTIELARGCRKLNAGTSMWETVSADGVLLVPSHSSLEIRWMT